ncbi:MAG TPA: AAA family ATPase [Polyangiaceae bacterium]|nr:AAA family ATPase [Polyangiaceae bacterium]
MLLGANDAGKSTLLRSLYEDLRSRPGREEPSPHRDGGAVFAEVTDQELGLLVPAYSDLAQADWGLGGYDVDEAPDLTRAPSRRASVVTMAEVHRWVDTLRRSSASGDSFNCVLDALADSRIVCFEPVNQLGEKRRFLAYWCLPPVSVLDPAVRRALEASELERFVTERGAADQGARSTKGPRFFFGGVDHLHAADAPVIVAPLAWTERVAPPEVLMTPAPYDDIRRAVTQAVADVVGEARYGESDFVQEIEWSDEIELERAIPRILLRAEEGGWRIDPVAIGTLALLRAEAQRLLPDFVGALYELVLVFRPVDRWFDSLPIDFSLRWRGSRNRSFAPEDLADGFHLWLQLALAGALSAVDNVRAQLEALSEAAGWDYMEAAQNRFADDFSEGEIALNLAIAEIVSAATASDPLMPSSSNPSALVVDERFATLARRVVIADEPERHLHPRLQRHAARWLGDLVNEAAAQCVVASHATAFLGVGDTVLNYVRRVGGSVIVEAIEAGALDALDTVAREVGFDRGELLSTISCFLLVEGEHDRVVLEGIFGQELRLAGVFIVPLRGSPRRSLLDVDTLWRFMTAPVAVALDNLPLEDVAAAQADPACLGRLRAPDATPEAKAVATILQAALGTDKRIEFLGHRGSDLIDALDDRAILEEFPTSGWPGQLAMQEAWLSYKAAHDASDGARKAWLQEAYGIDNGTGTYVRLAEAHRRLGLRPPALEAIVNAAIALALEYRAEDAMLTLPPPPAPESGPPF